VYASVAAIPKVTKNVTYTAQYSQIYNITYHLGGGSIDPIDANPTTYTEESAAITLVNPTKDGYEFAGWTGTGLASAQETVVIPTGSTGNREYWATWEPGMVEYTVEHYWQNADGTFPATTSDTETRTAKTGSSVTATAKTAAGYKCVDSYTFGGTVTSVKSGEVKADGSTVLKLYYVRTYTITWQDYDNSKTYTNNVLHGQEVAPLKAEQTRANRSDPDYNYTHAGWEQIVPAVAAGSPEATIVTSDMTFKAVYNAEAILRTATVKVYVDNVLTDLNTVLPGGKIFVKTHETGSAFVELTGTGGTYTAALPSGEYHVHVGTSESDCVHFENRILEVGQHADANARIDYYSVTYNPNGGTGGPNPQKEYYRVGDTVTISKQKPTLSGYVFDGWKDGNDNPYAASTPQKATVLTTAINQAYELTAQWKGAAKLNVRSQWTTETEAREERVPPPNRETCVFP